MTDLCFYSHGQSITFDTFRHHVLMARAAIKKNPCNKVLLFNADSFQFSVWLFALIAEKKHVLLPPNAQTGTLSQFAAHCDATAGSIRLTGKTQITNTPKSGLIEITPPPSTREQFFNLFSGEITFYTSGSTGQAKAIKKSCQQLRLEMDTLKSEFSTLFNQANTVVSTVSHQHIYGLLFKVLLPLLLGKIIINQTFEYPEHISRLLMELTPGWHVNQAKSVLLISSPAHLQRLAIDNVLVPHAPSFSAIFSSGGLLSLAASQALSQQMNLAPTEVYGSTETGGIAWRRGQNSSNEPWQVFPNIKPQLSIDGQRLEIFSPYVTEQPYITDDKIKLLDSNHFLLKGRIDRTVKIEEKRVNLDQIERHLVLHPWVDDARIIVINNRAANARKVLAAVLVLTPVGQGYLQDKGKLSFSKTLKQHLLSDIERICLPKKWRYLTEFPYNSQGKLVLNDLEKLFD
jgi:acyl-coenzyme A synthetase/AMP-(fatty) acid ligase